MLLTMEAGLTATMEVTRVEGRVEAEGQEQQGWSQPVAGVVGKGLEPVEGVAGKGPGLLGLTDLRERGRRALQSKMSDTQQIRPSCCSPILSTDFTGHGFSNESQQAIR